MWIVRFAVDAANNTRSRGFLSASSSLVDLQFRLQEDQVDLCPDPEDIVRVNNDLMETAT